MTPLYSQIYPAASSSCMQTNLCTVHSHNRLFCMYGTYVNRTSCWTHVRYICHQKSLLDSLQLTGICVKVLVYFTVFGLISGRGILGLPTPLRPILVTFVFCGALFEDARRGKTTLECSLKDTCRSVETTVAYKKDHFVFWKTQGNRHVRGKRAQLLLSCAHA